MFLILIPVLTMRLFSDEARQKTDQLLYTSPLTVAQIVLGKFFAAFALFVLSLTVTMVFPLILSRYGSVPVAETVGAFAGFIMLGACFVAVGLFISSLTESQIVAAVASFGALFTFFIIDAVAVGIPKDRTTSFIFLALIAGGIAYVIYDATKSYLIGIITGVVEAGILIAVFFLNPLLFDGTAFHVLTWFSVFTRFSRFGEGIFDLASIVYYATFTGAFVFLTVNVIEKRRWR
jgi:ABC-2 type transport system permease protein